MKHSDLISKLSLEQKVALLSGRDVWSTYPVESLGIPSMRMSDGPHGVRAQVGEGDHLGLNESLPATCFPTAATLANSWDPALTEKVGQMIGSEAACQGVNVLLGPGINTKRSPLGGRNFEYYSEDPYLTGKLAAGFVRGVQSNAISACPKHFAANSQEWFRLTNDSVVDERTLRELYLTAFELVVREASPHAIMSAYNKVNGTYANENKKLLTDILRDEWGFDGFVVTDWGGSSDHAAGVKAGSALEMPGTAGDSDQEIFAALEAGTLTEKNVDARVDELLDVVLSTHAATEAGIREFDQEAHHAAARNAAAQSLVMLKNKENILPLAPGTRVAVIGDMAFTPRYQGAGSSLINPTKLDTPLEQLAESGLNVVGTVPGYRRDGVADPAMKEEALKLADEADVVLLYLGLPEITESEGLDRANLSLPACQNELAEALAKANPNVVVLLAGGGAVELPWLDHCAALLACYLGGQAGAGAVADVLVGQTNPSGKLAETWPLKLADTPASRYFPGCERTSEYREGLFVGYRYYTTVHQTVQFPFGFGLSYTSFQYSDLEVAADSVSFTLTNTGSRAGAEAAQMYVSKPESQLFRPAVELKGFTKVSLEPGESRRMTIPLDEYTFRYYNVENKCWAVEPGDYIIWIGASSEDLRLSAGYRVDGIQPHCPYDREKLSCYYSGQIADVPDEQFEALLGHPIPDGRWDETAAIGINDPLARLVCAENCLARFAGRRLAKRYEDSLKADKPDLNILFIYNMPIRAIAKMTNGMVGMEMAQALLEAVNGHAFRGIGKMIGGFFRRSKQAKERRNGID